MQDTTQRNSGGTADADSVNIKGDNGGCSPTDCSASSFVSLREYDRMVANYDRMRTAVIGDEMPEMSDGYTLLRTDWKVEER
jgi:hypothetical protein